MSNATKIDSKPLNFELGKLSLKRMAPVLRQYSGEALRELSSGKYTPKFGLRQHIAVIESDRTLLLFLRLDSQLIAKTDEQSIVGEYALVNRYLFAYDGDLEEAGIVQNREDGSFSIDAIVHGLLLSISYATMRGQLTELFANTPFRSYLLPIQSVDTLMEMPVVKLTELGVRITPPIVNTKD